MSQASASRGVRVVVSVMVLVSVALAGCAVPSGPSESPVPPPSPFITWSPPTPPEPPGPSPPLTIPVGGDEAVPVSRPDGSPASVAWVHVRETVSASSETGVVQRSLCGGAVYAIPPGAADPRERLASLEYNVSTRVVDPEGRVFVTDVYADATVAEGEDGRVWVVNVGGGEAFVADDSGHCDPAVFESISYNALIDAPLEEVAVVFDGWERPAFPEARRWSDDAPGEDDGSAGTPDGGSGQDEAGGSEGASGE